MTIIKAIIAGAALSAIATAGAQAQQMYFGDHQAGMSHSLGGPLRDSGGCWTYTDRDRGLGYYTSCDTNAPGRVANRARRKDAEEGAGGN